MNVKMLTSAPVTKSATIIGLFGSEGQIRSKGYIRVRYGSWSGKARIEFGSTVTGIKFWSN